jgi:hypothetical protein
MWMQRTVSAAETLPELHRSLFDNEVLGKMRSCQRRLEQLQVLPTTARCQPSARAFSHSEPDCYDSWCSENRLALMLVCSVREGRRLGSDVEVTSQVCKFSTYQVLHHRAAGSSSGSMSISPCYLELRSIAQCALQAHLQTLDRPRWRRRWREA